MKNIYFCKSNKFKKIINFVKKPNRGGNPTNEAVKRKKFTLTNTFGKNLLKRKFDFAVSKNEFQPKKNINTITVYKYIYTATYKFNINKLWSTLF